MKINQIFSNPVTPEYSSVLNMQKQAASSVCNSTIEGKCASSKFCCCFQWIGEKISSACNWIKEKICLFFSCIFCGCCSKTEETPQISIKIEKKPISTTEEKKSKDILEDTFHVIPIKNEEPVSDFVLDYQKSGETKKYILIKEMRISKENLKYLPGILSNILQTEGAVGFALDNLAYAVFFDSMGYLTNNSVMYYSDHNGEFEQFIDKMLEKGEQVYSSEAQKNAFLNIQTLIVKDSSEDKSLWKSFVFVEKHGINLSLADVIELAKEIPLAELEKIPLNGREYQKGGYFYPLERNNVT